MDQGSEKELEKFINNRVQWESLPSHAKSILDQSQTKYKQYVLKYSIKHQLRWDTNLISNFVTDERLYYQEIIRLSVANLVLYPYHISDKLVPMLNVTPFKYYLIMMIETMTNSKSYDEIPNFTAVDCIRVLEIGRNQFIDLMNKCRSKGFLFKKKKDVIRSMLPSRSLEKNIDYWWILRYGYPNQDEEKGNNLPSAEFDVLDDLKKSVNGINGKQAGLYSRDAVLSLISKGLIYIDVPILNGDTISVPPLEGFVMNRVLGDYFENLLYKIFVSIDERTTIQKLSEVLQVNVELVKQACSLYCRLGFAKKKNLEPLLPSTTTVTTTSDGDTTTTTTPSKWHTSWITYYQENKQELDTPILPNKNNLPQPSTTNNNTGSSGDSLEIQSQDIDSSNTMATTAGVNEGSSSSNAVEEQFNGDEQKRIGFIFDSSITAFLMMGNLGYGLKNHAVTMFEVGKLANEALADFLQELDKIDVEEFVDSEARLYATNAISLRDTIRHLCNRYIINGHLQGLDLLSCERMNSLDEATRIRVLKKNYSVLISMAPLSIDNCPVISAIPPNFGPAVYEVHSFWFRMYLYHQIGKGPNSILYPKGTRLKKIPLVFKDCEKVLICSIDHDPVTVNLSQLLPSANETLLSSPILLSAYTYIKYDTAPKLSKLMSHSRSNSVVSLSKEDQLIYNIPFPLDESVTPNSTSLSDEEYDDNNIASHPLVHKIQSTFNLQNSFGYISLLKKEVHIQQAGGGAIQKVIEFLPLNIYFGIPIFDHRLVMCICEKMDKHNLLSEENLKRQGIDSRNLSLDLFNFISSTCMPIHPDLDSIDATKINSNLPSVQNIPLPTQTISFINGNLDL